jgi:Carboxypeptidase regulatory-like domain/TonB-dependent Receptor Plug Domain
VLHFRNVRSGDMGNFSLDDDSQPAVLNDVNAFVLVVFARVRLATIVDWVRASPSMHRFGLCDSARKGDISMLRNCAGFVLTLFVVIVGITTITMGQEVQATLTGTVTDPSGAVVPGATIVVHNDETNADVRVITTNSMGGFNITNLAAGRYQVTVQSGGFQRYVASGVVLNVAEKHTLNVQLSTGQVSQTVEVSAENIPIQTTSAEQSGTITGEQVRELALDNRNFEQLVVLQPGVASQLPDKVGFGLNNNTQIAVNGARTGANNWTVDGADINDSGSNGTLLNTPSIDAIQEFTLQRSNYDASFGRSGGGQILLATKSGTDQFHGDVYEFNRNNFYNANTFPARANIAAGQPYSENSVPIERYNDFGFTIGGPLFIPHVYRPVKNKTFFFWSEEWRKATTPGTNIITVPTAAELHGIFTSPIPVAPPGCVSSANGTDTISPACISKNATAYLNAFMLANPANASGQLVTNFSQLNNFREDNIRLDQLLGDKVRVFARYLQDSVPQSFPFGLWGVTNYPGVENTSLNAPGRNLVVNATATLSPKVVNEVEFVDAWGAINSDLSNATANSPAFLSKLTNNTVYTDPNGRAPDVTFASGAAGLSNSSAPYFERNKDRNIFDNLTIQHGNHTIHTGLTFMWMEKTENASAGYATFTFSNANGNPEFANFLLGQATQYTQPSKDTIPDLHYLNFETYVQDDWKVTRRLTLNLGLRYSYFPSPSDSNNTLVNFDPFLFNPAKAPVINPATGQMVLGSPNANAATYANGLIFPTGAACSAAQAVGPLVSCSPYGSKVNPGSNKNFGPRFGFAYDPFGTGKWVIRAGYGLYYDRTLNGIWEQNAFNDPPLVQTATVNNNGTATLNLFDHPTAGAPAGAPVGPVNLTVTGNPTFKVPSYQDYSLSVQHELMRNTVLEVAFVGTRGTHLLGDMDINQPTEAARLASPIADANTLVPNLGYQSIVSRNPVFTSNYNSLQVSANRRLSRGLTLGVAYTWSKLLTTNPQDRSLGAYDTYNLRGDYGLSTLNTPQMLVISYVYDFPFYQNQKGIIGHVLGGWELSGITNFQSGQSVTVVQATDPFATPVNNNSGLNLARDSATAAQIRTDLIGNPQGPKTPAEFFNTAAFAIASGHFGDERPGTVLGPGLQLWDMALIKNFSFGERARLQLRLESFNTFNHGNPGGGNNDGLDPNINSPTYGQVNAWHDPRNLQIGAKLNF